MSWPMQRRQGASWETPVCLRILACVRIEASVMSNAWNEIITYLKQARLFDACGLNEGATSQELAQLEQHIGQSLPQELHAFLSEHNGQKSSRLGIYVGCELLSTESICQQWNTWRSIDEPAMNEDCAEFMSSNPSGAIKPMYTNRCWVPLTHDHGGNHIGLDFDPGPNGVRGQVIAYGRDEDEKQLLANSFKEFLPVLVANVRDGDWSFADELRGRA